VVIEGKYRWKKDEPNENQLRRFLEDEMQLSV
jgi:hypothetical protein